MTHFLTFRFFNEIHFDCIAILEILISNLNWRQKLILNYKEGALSIVFVCCWFFFDISWPKNHMEMIQQLEGPLDGTRLFKCKFQVALKKLEWTLAAGENHWQSLVGLLRNENVVSYHTTVTSEIHQVSPPIIAFIVFVLALFVTCFY